MTPFIAAVLVLAALQSFCKLSLVSRKWEVLLALILFGLPFYFEERIAGISMLKMNSELSSPATLSNWCALVVIQELLALVAGGALLAALQEEERPLPRWKRGVRCWKYLFFVPSLLLPTGALYLQMYLFNSWVSWKFHHLSWLLAISLPLLMILIAETCRLLFRAMEKRILAVVHVEYLLLLPAIFLPVAATAEFIPAQDAIFPRESLVLLLGFAGFEFVTIMIFHVFRRMKRNVHCHSNS